MAIKMDNSLMIFERPRYSKLKLFFKKLNSYIFDFHEYDIRNRKPYILTPCNHAFHSSCLESWLKQKRECPTDRTPIEIADDNY
jgi:hypothetical protein